MDELMLNLARAAYKNNPALSGLSSSSSKSETPAATSPTSPYPAQGAAMSPADHPANNIEPMQVFEHPASAQGIKPGFGTN